MNSRKPQSLKNPNVGKIDRLSALPDSVICHILSFLPTKYAVPTSILSTRWKNLFASVPVIDLDDELLLHPQKYKYSARTSYDFINFVYKVLLLRNTSALDRFRLRCVHLEDGVSSSIYTWVCSILLRNVQEIDIYVHLDLRGNLPPELFCCKTLVTLKLRGNFALNGRGSVCLPNLKTLHLKHVRLCNDESISKLISGCQMLEELRLDKCIMNELQVLHISSRSLQHLSILADLDELGDYSVVIDTPNLRILRYDDCVAKSYQVKNLQSHVVACIHISLGKGYPEESKMQLYQRASKFISEMYMVRGLFLSANSMEALYASGSTLPTFPMLVVMKLGINHRCGLLLLPELLASSPYLGGLFLDQGLLDSTTCKGKEFKYCLPSQVPMCLSRSLIIIDFVNSQGLDCEFKLIEYFL